MNKAFYTTLVVTLVTLASCKSDEAKVEKETLQVETETISRTTDYSSQSYVGVVEAEASSLVSFTGTGAIVEMAVREGQHVRKGQLIARLDETQARNLLNQAQYGHEQARKTEEQSMTATEQAQYTQEQAKYVREQSSVGQQQAQNALALAKATLDEALDAQARMKVLHDNNSLPEMKWVEVQTKVQQAQASYNTALKNCETASITTKQSDVSYKQTEVGTRQAQNVNAQSQVATKQAGVNVDIARKNLQDCAIYAPCDGVVVTKYLNVGEVALPSQPIVKIMTNNNVKVTVSVPEKDMAGITDGMRTIVRCAALEGEEWVSTSLVKDLSGDPLTHTYKVKVNVPSAGSKLLPGMVCNVLFSSEDATPEITVPIRAVQQKMDGSNFVWVAKDGKAHRQEVAIGKTIGNRIIITSGLTEGTKVITEGYQKVDEGGAIILSK